MAIATKREIEELLARTYPALDSGKSEFAGMNYEDGIRAACEFILGEMGASLDDVISENPPEDD